MTLPVLTTARLELRPLELSDLGQMEELSGNYEVSKMLSSVPFPYDRARGVAYLREAEAAQAKWPKSARADFAISQDGRLIGLIVLRELHEAPGIGYWLGEPYWGKGLMSEALTEVLRWLFRETNVETLRAEVMKDNPASCKVLKKLGFSVVGEGTSMSLARKSLADDWYLEVTRQDFTAHLLG
ncbi:GNAT family N-acetyltransferase [Roseibium sp.]|uniref:GNAT family N-acetyltransferase n=1 Tax=Roseibium sp. TaxID=1936156 RepID=UPI003A96C630